MDQRRILCFKKNLHIGDQVGSGGGAAHHFLQVLQNGLPPLQLSFVDITPAENAAVGKAGGHTYWITVVAAVGIVVHTFFYSCPVFQTLNALFQCVCWCIGHLKHLALHSLFHYNILLLLCVLHKNI